MAVETAEDFPYEFLPGGREYPWHRIPRRFYFYESEGGVIWGITAELLYHALGVLSGRSAAGRLPSEESGEEAPKKSAPDRMKGLKPTTGGILIADGGKALS